ncbi:hypothetical protein KGP26_21465 [Serratia sp. JSRIV002]|uniref:fimbrial protein n=1 Tax=Serratia sp. JSRIV002 TaxID=2831894 RepID=UPI001CBECEB3|nr:hypothetical protein [Serratia sp. JSRIV002]UAN50285.1 hypothetical protein KGP26_21465 [Serratia sp. JSRIV002]
MNVLFSINKKRSWSIMLRMLLLLCLSVLTMENAYALKCVNASDQSFSFVENIGSVAVPITAPNGTLIWRSENRTMTITCWKDFGGTTESPYAYFNPASASLGAGIRVGMNFNGTDVPNIFSASKLAVPGVRVPECFNTEAVCKPITSTTFTISYYIYINKYGTPSGSNYSGPNTLAVFQLDGVGGLNITPNSNYRYSTTNMQGIRFTACEAAISVSPSSIDFGTVAATSASANTVAASSNFTVNITKSCNDPFKLTASYGSPTNRLDANTLNVLAGVGVKIKNLTTGNYIQYSDVEDLADLTIVNSASVPYLAEMVWQNSTPALGTFSTAVTITAYYN